MKTCPNCGKELPHDCERCDACGVIFDTPDTTTEASENEGFIPKNTMKTETEASDAARDTADNATSRCPNCGSSVSEQAFCSVCGARLQDTTAPLDPSTAEVDDAITSGSKNKGVVIGAIVAIIVVLFAVFAFASPVVKNYIAKTFSSPQEYFSYVVNHAVEEAAEPIANNFDTNKALTMETLSASGDIRIVKGDQLIPFLKNFIPAEATEGILRWFESAGLTYNFVNGKDGVGLNAELALNETPIVTYSMVNDAATGDIYLSFPTYQSTALSMATQSSASRYESSMEIYQAWISALPSGEAFKEMLKRYTLCVCDNIQDVSKSKETLDAAGISQKVTVLTATIDYPTCKSIAIDFLLELKSDPEIIRFIDEIASTINANSEDFIHAVNEAIEDVQAATEPDEGFPLVCTLYVNSRSEIIGFSLSDAPAAFSLSSFTTTDGNQYGSVFSYASSGVSVAVEGSGTQSENTRSGNYVFKYNNIPLVNIQVFALQYDKLLAGFVHGDIELRLTDEAIGTIVAATDNALPANVLKDLSVKLNSRAPSVDKTAGVLSISSGDDVLIEFSANCNLEKGGELRLPSDYIRADNEEAVAQWLLSFDFEALINNLRTAGVPDPLIAMLLESIAQEASN